MTKNLLLSTLILLFASLSFGQIKFNPKIGMNVSNFTQEDDLFESSGSFGFGLGLDTRIGGRFYFAPGLFYLTSSTKIKKFNSISVDEVAKFNTIEMPLTLGFSVINKENLKIGIKAGIEGAYFASISEVAQLNQDDYERLNWGYQFGVGADLKRFTFDLKFDLGKNSSLKESVADSFNPQYNRFHLYLGYLF